MNADDRNKLWDQTYRKEIGEALKVKFPDGEIVPLWQLWATVVRTPGAPGKYAQESVASLLRIFETQISEVPAGQRLMRASRIFLQCNAFEVTGHDGDAHDMKALALFQGLAPNEFEIIEDQGEPHLRLDEDSLAKFAGAENGSEVVERMLGAQAVVDQGLLPEFIPNPHDREGCLMNSSGVIELAKLTDTPQAKQLLKDYHTAEADIASEFPFWSEKKIRDEAMMRTLHKGGWKVSRQGNA